MASGEDKRSVAQKVRMLAATDGRKRGLAAGAATWRKLQSILGMEGIVGMDARLFHLADLIDPTCEAEPMDDYVPSHAFSRWRCKSCGAVSVAPRTFGMPRFCPHCGARVVDEDD